MLNSAVKKVNVNFKIIIDSNEKTLTVFMNLMVIPLFKNYFPLLN